MKAVQLIAHGAPGTTRLNELPELTPGPDEVVVRVRACGLNHLDLWIEQGELPVPISLPRTLGAEPAGEVWRVGADAGAWRVGDRVAAQSHLFCGACEFCLKGEEPLCLKGKLLGVDCDGGLAEELVVPGRTLVRLPDRVAFEEAAAVTLAGSTAMQMLRHRTEVRPGDWVLVMGGASGVGSAAIQIARAMGGRVIATASTPAKSELATRLGASAVVRLDDAEWPRRVRELTANRGVDLVVEHLGGRVLEEAFRCLARGGRVVTCGATLGREVTLPLWPFFVKEFSLIGSYGRTQGDLEWTLRWVAEGKLRPVIDAIYPMERAGEGLRRLRERRVLGKIVVQTGAA